MGFVARSAVVLALVLAIAPAAALTEKDKSDCEQAVDPALKVAACSRILGTKNLPNELQSFAHHHRGVGLLLQNNFDDGIIEFNAALQADPKNVKSYNSRGNAWRGKGELDIAIADYN